MEGFSDLRLRGVTKVDLPRIAELEEIAFGANGLPRSTLDVLFDPSGVLWLAVEDDEDIWGYSFNLHGEDASVGWIVGMAIHPDRQRRGWGQLLLRATIDRLHDYGMEVIRLMVNPTNKVARRIYENFGFIDTGERTTLAETGETRILMTLLRTDTHKA